MRPSGRATDAMRPISLDPGVAKYAEGSCLAKFGDTQVLCTASVEERVPPFLRNTGKGWVTAEGAPFDDRLFAEMMELARAGIAELTRRQRATLGLS